MIENHEASISASWLSKQFLCQSIYGAKYSIMDRVKFFKGCLPQTLLGPLLNTLTYISHTVNPRGCNTGMYHEEIAEKKNKTGKRSLYEGYGERGMDLNTTLVFPHFMPMFHFYSPWKRQKTRAFLRFSGVIKMEHWLKKG